MADLIDDPPRDILIVDDEHALAELVEIVLTHAGYAVRMVHTGAEALHAIAEHAPALLILDVMMPEMSGFDVIDRLRQARQTIPTILMSVLEQEQVVPRLRTTAITYLHKPFALDALLDCVQQMLA
jgi:two-component system, OmpR family, response regulator